MRASWEVKFQKWNISCSKAPKSNKTKSSEIDRLQNYGYLEKYLWGTTFGFLWNLKNFDLTFISFVYSDLEYCNLIKLLCYICYDFKSQSASSVVLSIFPSFRDLFIHCSYFKDDC